LLFQLVIRVLVGLSFVRRCACCVLYH